MGTSVVSGNGSSLNGSSTRLPPRTSAGDARPTPSAPKLTKTQVEANAYDGAQLMTSGGTVSLSARIVFLRISDPARSSVRIPTEIQTDIDGQTVSRRIQFKNVGTIPVTVSYAGGKIAGDSSATVNPGASLDLAALPVVVGAAVAEYVIILD